MKKLLNTLYVSTQGVYLHRESETLLAELNRQIVLRLPIHTLSSIVCFGNILVSPFLLGLCVERGIHLSFLTENGRPLAHIDGGPTGNVLLRKTQILTACDPQKSAALARSFIIGKILNSRAILQRRLRDHGPDPTCTVAITHLANVAQRLKLIPDDLEAIRGLEGEAAASYFNAFNSMLVAQTTDFHITDRNRRPPRDPMNALLSFLYTLLAHDCIGAAKSVGLDAQVGFLHALRPGRSSLALDLMEEFRAPLADRLALSLINRAQLHKKDFRTTESGAVEMSDTARKTVLTEWQNRKREEVLHPFLNERIPIGLLPFVQAQLLARTLRGDLDAYPPFLVK